jgi:hypothetical protein
MKNKILLRGNGRFCFFKVRRPWRVHPMFPLGNEQYRCGGRENIRLKIIRLKSQAGLTNEGKERR